MTGLEKIIGKINSESEQRSNDIIAAAKKQCENTEVQARENGKKIAADIEKEAAAQAENILMVAKSGIAQQTRQTVLAAKVEAVNETLDELVSALVSLPSEEYFPAVIKLAAENAMPGECKAMLCKKDLKRLPADFATKLDSALSAKGVRASISDEPADINSGILLDYGNIAIDCSFEAIIEEESDLYKEKISEIIFKQAVN